MVSSTVGTTAGAVEFSPAASPNVFLHMCLYLWIKCGRKKRANGEVVVIRYATHFVIALNAQGRAEADCLDELRTRFEKFGFGSFHGHEDGA